MGQRYDFFLNRPTFFNEKGSPSLISKKEEPVYVPFLAKIQPGIGAVSYWLCLIDGLSYTISFCAAKLLKSFETGLVQIGSFSNTDEENEKSMVENGEKYVSLLQKKE